MRPGWLRFLHWFDTIRIPFATGPPEAQLAPCVRGHHMNYLDLSRTLALSKIWDTD